MLRAVLDARLLLATLCAAAVGVCGLRAYPFDRSDVFLAVIEARRPGIAGEDSATMLLRHESAAVSVVDCT